MLRALLCHLSLWDPSSHGLLALKHILMAFRMQPPPQSLYPTPVTGAAVGDQEGGLTPRDSRSGETPRHANETMVDVQRGNMCFDPS